MFNAFRRFLGLPQPEVTVDNNVVEARPPSPPPDHIPYGGCPVPNDAALDPKDAFWYADWFEQYSVVPANDGQSVLVFLHHFLSESPTGGEPNMDPDVLAEPDDRQEPRRNNKYTIQIYERLFADGASHRNVVQYLGPTPSGFRLERLLYGPMPCRYPDPSTADVILAIYQRWAIQILSGLAFIHSKGIILNACLKPSTMALWLREDLSIAIAGLVAAGCIDLDIRADGWMEGWAVPRPWDMGMTQRESPPFTHNETGHPKSDISGWACLIYMLMSDGGNPLIGGNRATYRNCEREERKRRERAARDGTFDDWPELDASMLGPQLVKAWKGEYESADEALQDVIQALRRLGRQVSAEPSVDILGFDWSRELEIVLDGKSYMYNELRLRSERTD